MTDLHDRVSALSPAKRALLERLRVAGAAPIPRIAGNAAPLSAEQRRLWYLLQLAPHRPIYTIPQGFRLRGPVDVEALTGALRDLVHRHEALRTAFRESAGVPVQVVGDGAAFEPCVLDLRGDEWADAEANYQQDDFARRTFDLAHGDTFHALLVRQEDEDFRLLLAVHHLAADGWSMAVLLRELGALYAARLEGARAPLAEPALRYRDWAAWQQRPDAPPPAAEEAYWRAQLAGARHVLEIPPDRPRPPIQAWDGAKLPFDLPHALAAEVRALARRQGATPFAVVAAAFALVLCRYAGEDDFLLGTVFANRPRPELENVAGFFANTLPLRMRLDGGPTAGELVRRAHAAAVGAQAHASLPFDRIVDLADVRRDFSRPPLVQAVLTWADAPSSALHLPGVAIEPVHLDTLTSVFELTLAMEDHGERLSGAFQFSTALFEHLTIRRMATHLEAALAAFVADPEQPVSAVHLAWASETRQVERWSVAPPAPPPGDCIHHLFERQARETPERTALVWGDERISYAELNRRANRIAHGLRARGAGAEARVAVCLERTPVLVAALLGVLKAGAAYVPMDPAHPPARHQAVLRLSGARLAVGGDSIRGSAGGMDGVRVIAPSALEAGRDDDPASPVFPENLAYVIFTSGSTGGPKGVEIEHRSSVALLAWMRGLLSDEERSGVFGSSSVTFDAAVSEIFGTLAWGGTLVLVENSLAAPPPEPPLRAAAMVPTAAAELLREGRFPPRVESVLLGGEPVPLPLARELIAQPAVRRVLNLYGPTEDTTYSTSAELDPLAHRVSIGRPIDGGRVYVLDPLLRHAGAGVPGEVWTAGAGVARGYASRPALTAERFRPDPHGPPGSRMYRTLDRGRWREDGGLEYLGRGDAQVKVRGYRIELEEVEQALAAHPAVAEAAATARGETGAGRRLVAYLVARGGAERPSSAELRAFVRERVPEYMVPGAFAWVDALPRTTSGKLDRRALPEHEGEGPAPGAYVAPRNAVEQRLAEIWRQVLDVERVGVHDDFFDLGGQSILAMRLVARVRDEVGADVAVAELLQAPTLAEMAAAITTRRDTVRLPLVPLQTFGTRPPLFLVHPAGGHVVCYRGLATLLAPEQPVYALQPLGVQRGETPIGSIREMAAYYVAAVRQMRPRGPYRLGGWSFGGVVAWEMAQQLAAAGAEVDMLALFDTAPHTPGAIKIDHGDPAEVVWWTVGGMAGYGAASRVSIDELRPYQGRELVRQMIVRMNAPHLMDESRVDDVLLLTELRAANLKAQGGYTPRPYPGRLTYFRTTGSEDASGVSHGQVFWSGLALGGTAAHGVGGTHSTILDDPYVQVLADVLLADGAPGDE